MSRYKVIYKNDGLLFHEHIEAKNIDDLAFRIRYQYGEDALLIYARKENKNAKLDRRNNEAKREER